MIIIIVLVIILSISIYLLVSKKSTSLSKPTAAKPPVATPTAAKPPVATPTAAKPPVATPTAAKPPAAPAATPAAAKPPAATPAAAKPPAAPPPKPPVPPIVPPTSLLGKGAGFATGMVKDMVNNPANTAGQITQMVLEAKIGNMAKKHMVKHGQKSLTKVAKKFVQKVGKDILKKFGLMGGKIAKEVLEEAAEKVVVSVAKKAGMQLAQKGAASAMFGPAAPIVGPALMAFSIVSIGLDIMDVGGFSKIQTLDNFADIKKGAEDQAKKAYAESGSPYPGLVGPLSKLDNNVVSEQIQKVIDAMMADPKNPYMKPMNDAISSDLANNKLTPEDLDKEGTMDKYMALMDMDGMYSAASDQICIKYDGMLVKDTAGEKQCTYKSKDLCDKSYTWNNAGKPDSPLKDDETYAEWLPYNNQGNACVVSSFAVRQTCENMGNLKGTPLTYVPGGTCILTEKYCSLMGQSNRPNPKYGGALDCYTSLAQNFMEGILGEVVTKGLAAVMFKDGYVYNAVSGVYEDFIPENIRKNDLVKGVTKHLTPMMLVPGYSQYQVAKAFINAASHPAATAAKISDMATDLADAVSNPAATAAKIKAKADKFGSDVSNLALDTGKMIVNAPAEIAKKTVAAANAVANTTVNAANTVAGGTVKAANVVAGGTVKAANVVAGGTVKAANAVANVGNKAISVLKKF
jgi:hypothetical protein